MPRILMTLLFAVALSGSALAQTAPKTKSAGAEPPKTALYVGNSFFYFNNGMSGIAGLDPKTARFLQEVAHETVREYLGL
jgi:hypothetical protein